MKCEDFDRKVKEKGMNLVVAKSSKNRIFGGFTSLSWGNRSEIYKTDPYAFLFSCDLKKVYHVTDIESAIRYSNSAICCFGRGDMKIFPKGIASFEVH